MTIQFTSNTLPGLYNDDFDDNANYHQILFNTGRALQARELTQLQTMIYREMGRFAKNVFKEGAIVSSAPVSLNSNYSYVKIASTNEGGAFEDIPVGTIFINPNTGVRAQVLQVVEANDAEFVFDTLYIQYIDTNSSAVAGEKTTFGDGETIYSENISGNTYVLVTENPNAVGEGTVFNVGEGDYFVMGRFVHISPQTLVLSPYSQSVTTTVGFKVVQDVVTINDTSALYDNAGGLVNVTSPGADRYRIRLVLTTKDKMTANDTFVFLANVENSVITEIIDPNDSYNKINDLLALRTKEESGNYIVDPFLINITEGVIDSNLELVVSRGTAYVNGYRVHNPSPIKLLVPKPSETETVENDVIPVIYGNYFLADSCRGLPDLDLAKVNLYSAYGASGSTIGTARIRAVERDGVDLRVYVFDVNMNSGQDLRDVYSIGTSATNRFNLSRETTGAKLYGVSDNDLLFPTPRPRPESFSDVVITYQKHQTGTTNGAGSITLTAGSGESYVESSLWVISSATASFVTSYSVTGIGTNSVTITGLSNATAYEFLTYVQKSSTSSTTLAKSKTPTTITTTIGRKVDSAGIYYNLGYPDVYQIDSVRAGSSTGQDMTSTVTFDNGQRDNYYADSLLRLNGDSVGPLYVKFKYFARGATGNYYDATSYSSIAYRDIPDHVLKDGTLINLRNYLDFRPDIDSSGTVSNNHSLPRNGSNLTADANYYLPRADKLLATQEGDIVLLMGQQAANPQFKPTPDNALELYKIVLNANTLDEEDLQVTPIEHKRYTMADIAKLEAKIDQIAEYTTLSIRELELKLTSVLDSDGNVRPESGFVVDDFTDQTGSETTNPDYSASLDPESKLVRPKLDEDNIRLVIANALSSNIVKRGDNVYLNYDSEAWSSQLLASKTVNVNPFGFVDNVGTLKLSPSTDEWKESFTEAQRAIGGANRLDVVQAFLWNNWLWNWCGRSSEDIHLNYDANRHSGTPSGGRDYLNMRENYYTSNTMLGNATSNGKYVGRVVASDTIRHVVGNKIVDCALIPWIRSRKVFFHAKGLTPNTRFTPFFDGVNVSSWCREETTFVNWSDRDSDYGNLFTSSSYTEHPEGTSDLISDENGEIVGSFFIPNIRPDYNVTTTRKGKKRKTYNGVRFRAGVREFKLLDISVNDWAKAGSKAFAYYTSIGAINNRVGAVLSTRAQQYTLPYGGFVNLNIPSIYTTNEMTTLLNQVGVADLGILDPKLAGQYGTAAAPLSGAAVNLLDVNSQMAQILSDYVGVNYNQNSTSEGQVLSPPQNPMAQTFYVDNQYGLVLTKINLFFAAKPATSNYPVSIHIRPVENGKPSVVDIVPGSHVFLNPGDVSVTSTDATLALIQQSPTSFVFEEPIFLQPWTQYAIVVTSQSTEYVLFTAKATQPVYGSTSRLVTTQEASGALFLPSSGMLWVESKDEDLMYQIWRANFKVGGGTLILKNARLPAKLLQNNPIRTTKDTKKLYFTHPCHGLEPGDPVIIADAVDVAGITAAYINGNRSVDSADIHGFTITAGSGASNATSSIVGGGDDVITTRNRVFNVANPYLETIIPNFTSLDISAKFTSGKMISGSSTRFVKDAQYSRITPKMNLEFNTPKAIYERNVEISELDGSNSVYVKVDFKTSNNYVSPVLDLQRSSLILVQYCIDNPEITPHIHEVAETEPYGGTTGSKHVTTPVFLEQDAVGMQVKINANLPQGSFIDFYYRTAGPDEDINYKNWIPQNPLNSVPNDNSTTFRDIEYLPGGQGGTLNAFNQAQMKVVFRGSTVIGGGVAIRDIRAKFMSV